MTRRIGLPLLLALMLLVAAVDARADATVGDLLAAYPRPVVEQLLEKHFALVPPGVGGTDYPGLRALVVFDRPRSRVMRLLSQSARQNEYRPELSGLERISESGGWVTDEHLIRMLFMSVVYRVQSHADFDAYRIAWRLDQSTDNDLSALEGFWELYEFEQTRTVGHFGTITKVSDRMPQFLQDAITRRNVPTMLENCRLWVDSDGRARP